MARDKHERVEFILSRETDQDKIAFVKALKAEGGLSDLMRDLLDRAMAGDFNAKADVVAMAAIDELRANQQQLWDEFQSIRDQMTASGENADTNKILAKLARRMDDLEHRLDTMQVIGAVEVDTPPPTTREERLSSKLKSIRFGALH